MTDGIEVLTHSSIRIRCGAGVVYVDPFHVDGAPGDADYILITHDHYDHFSPEDIQRVAKAGTLLAVPEAMLAKAEKEAGQLAARIYPVGTKGTHTLGSLTFETVPAYNKLKPFHPKSAGWVGYILQADGRRIYIAGDTDCTEEAKSVRCDVALVPVGGTYTMDAAKAAELVNAISPGLAIPTHYGSIVGKAGDAEAFRSLVKPPVRVEIRMRT